MANLVLVIASGKKPHDHLANTKACTWEGQAKRSWADKYMTSGIPIYVLNKKSELCGIANNVRCYEKRDVNIIPKFTFELLPPPEPRVNTHLVVKDDEKYRYRKQTLHKYGLRVVKGSLNEGIFVCEIT